MGCGARLRVSACVCQPPGCCALALRDGAGSLHLPLGRRPSHVTGALGSSCRLQRRRWRQPWLREPLLWPANGRAASSKSGGGRESAHELDWSGFWTKRHDAGVANLDGLVGRAVDKIRATTRAAASFACALFPPCLPACLHCIVTHNKLFVSSVVAGKVPCLVLAGRAQHAYGCHVLGELFLTGQ